MGQILVVLRSKELAGSHWIVGNKGSNSSEGRLFVSCVWCCVGTDLSPVQRTRKGCVYLNVCDIE